MLWWSITVGRFPACTTLLYVWIPCVHHQASLVSFLFLWQLDKWISCVHCLIPVVQLDKWIPCVHCLIPGVQFDKWIPCVHCLIPGVQFDKWIPCVHCLIPGVQLGKWIPCVHCLIPGVQFDKWIPVFTAWFLLCSLISESLCSLPDSWCAVW